MTSHINANLSLRRFGFNASGRSGATIWRGLSSPNLSTIIKLDNNKNRYQPPYPRVVGRRLGQDGDDFMEELLVPSISEPPGRVDTDNLINSFTELSPTKISGVSLQIV